jgi:hypothetical protein
LSALEEIAIAERPNAVPQSCDMIIMSVKHTQRRDKYITFWRPDDKGYCWALENAGRYPDTHVRQHLGYYDSGCSNVAVPAEAVLFLSSAAVIEGRFVTAVRNTAPNRHALLALASAARKRREPAPDVQVTP